MKEAGAVVHLLSLNRGQVQGMHHADKADRFTVDELVGEVAAEDYDALVLPGGVLNPDALRVDEAAVNFVKQCVSLGKPVAAICHGPWTLVEADVVRGKTLTSWPSLQTDIRNAGGRWVDVEVQVDDGLITSRKPDDLDAFTRTSIEEFSRLRA
jgi:protease I